MVTVATKQATEDPRACYDAPACPCYSCDRQCGGTIHPQSCGPVEADAEGRPICATCRDLAQVWGDHGTGVRAEVSQDRVRVAVKFGESCWMNPNSARRLAAILNDLAARLDKDREADALSGCTCPTRVAGSHRPPCPWAMQP